LKRKRLRKILTKLKKTPYQGLGKPEELKYNMKGYWSRELSKKDRIIYQVGDDKIIIHQYLGHYDDK
jgi:toxin YoeB